MAKTFSQLESAAQEEVVAIMNSVTGGSLVQTGPDVVVNMRSKSSSGMDFVEISVEALADLVSKMITK